jgi:AcrR family transcriptional regulator
MPENIDQPLAGRAARGRSTRDRPAKTPLSLEAVVDAALEILKSDGLAAITMRRVATALDTGPASLYVYVDGREGLLQAMLDRVVSAIELEEPDPSRWRAQLHGLLRRQRQALLSHPGTAALTVADPPTSGSTLMMAENLMGILMAGGLDPQTAAWACDMLVLLVSAVASEDEARRAVGVDHGRSIEEHIEEVRQTLATLPPDRFPLLTTYAAEMVAGDAEERFSFAIDVTIDGVLAWSSAHR